MRIQRVVTVSDPDVDLLPADLRGVLTEREAEAVRAGPEYFAGLADADSPKWLRAMLEKCAEDQFELKFYSFGDAPYRAYFRFEWGGEPTVGLPRPGSPKADVPDFLRNIYRVIGSFRENGFDEAGGLHAIEDLGPMSEMGIWVEPGGPVDPATAVPFLETLAGSQLCYLPDGGGAWLEACRFRPVKNLEREVARYFEALLKGKRI